MDDSQTVKLNGPIARRLSLVTATAGEDGVMSTVLPEDLVVDLISERLQVSLAVMYSIVKITIN